MLREPRALWLLLIAICAGYAVFASLVSVAFTAIYGLSRWSLKPDSTAIFPYLVLVNLVVWVGYAMLMPVVFWLEFCREGRVRGRWLGAWVVLFAAFALVEFTAERRLRKM